MPGNRSCGECPTDLPQELQIEQALAPMLRSLRQGAGARAPESAGAIEYDSWLRLLR